MKELRDWETNHDLKTPWGFTLEEAFEAFQFKRTALNDTSPFNMYRELRDGIDKAFFGGESYRCRSNSCQNPTIGVEKNRPTMGLPINTRPSVEKWCHGHYAKLWEFRTEKDKVKQKRRENLRYYIDHVWDENEHGGGLRSNQHKEIEEAIRQHEKRIEDQIKASQRANRLREIESGTLFHEKVDLNRILLPLRDARKRSLAARPKRVRYTGPPRKGYVYRLFDKENVLLYVGKTYSVRERLFGIGGHSRTKYWWEIVDEVEVTVYKTESEAIMSEALAIRREKPKFNVAQPIPKTNRAPRRVAKYRGAVHTDYINF